MKLYYHKSSSASLRVTIYLNYRQVPESIIELVSTGLRIDERGIPKYTMPENDPETINLGSDELSKFNPEGRVPILLLSDGKKMTQSGAIIEYIEDRLLNVDRSLKPIIPQDPWERAEVKRIMYIIAADVQPYQNIPFLVQAMGEWGMIKTPPLQHPLRMHFIRREFGALENILALTSGNFCVGNSITYADCFLVPQVRNALASDKNLLTEFPQIEKVWNNMLTESSVYDTLINSGGIIQPIIIDEEQIKKYTSLKD